MGIRPHFPAERFVLAMLTVCLSAVMMCTVFGSEVAAAGDDPIPERIRDAKWGQSLEQTREMLEGAGDTKLGDVPRRPPRKRLTWTPKLHPHYQSVEFDFTEKDRLYSMRFNLTEELRWGFKDLKKQFFDKYSISWEFPGHFRVKDSDVMMYVPENRKVPHFLEIKGVHSGKRTFELFNKNISGLDGAEYRKQQRAAKNKAGKQEASPEDAKAAAEEKPSMEVKKSQGEASDADKETSTPDKSAEGKAPAAKESSDKEKPSTDDKVESKTEQSTESESKTP